MSRSRSDITDEVVGIIPAGGLGTRMGHIPCSKEIFPIGFRNELKEKTTQTKVVSHYLLERMKLAGIENVFFIIRNNKWDIPGYFGDGRIVDMNIGYVMMGVPYGTPFTLNQAFPFVQDKVIAMGFPDILFSPKEAYSIILKRLYESDSDAVLGLFKTDKPHKMDMVDVDNDGKVIDIIIKSAKISLEYTWTIAVWKPVFSSFLNGMIYTLLDNSAHDTDFTKIRNGRELYVGDVFISALNKGMHIEAVAFPDGFTMDIGTPEDLQRALTISQTF